MHPQHPQPAPRYDQRPAPTQLAPLVSSQPTAWQSIPRFIRFAVWLIAILTVIWLFVVPVLAFIAAVSGGLASSGGM